MAKIKSLKQSPLFKDLSNREIALFSQIVDEISFSQGDKIASDGHGLILIKKGAVQAIYQAAGQTAFTVHLGPGEFFGELSVLSGNGFHGDRLPLSLFCEQASEVLQILPDRFYTLAQKEPELCFKVVRAISQYFGAKLLKHQKIIAKSSLSRLSIVNL